MVMSDKDNGAHGTACFLVQDTSGESQSVTTEIRDDMVESELSSVYAPEPGVDIVVEESLEDCE
jgi:hypothetical protein